MADEKKMPRAPLKLASVEDVSRYLTTVTKMLHNDLITPQKATALRGLCQAKLDSFKQNNNTNSRVQINIGLAMGSGSNEPVRVTGKKVKKGIENDSPEPFDDFTELNAQIEEVLADV